MSTFNYTYGKQLNDPNNYTHIQYPIKSDSSADGRIGLIQDIDIGVMKGFGYTADGYNSDTSQINNFESFVSTVDILFKNLNNRISDLQTIVDELTATIAVEGISLDKTTLSVNANGTNTINATVTPSNATNKTVNWSSSDTTIATVTASTTSGNNAIVTWKKAGTCTITATAAGNTSKIAVCTVTCQSTTVAVEGISLDKTTLSVNANGTNTINATVTPSNATNKTVNWSSSDTTIATVTASTTSGNNAIVTWKKAGTCTITAIAEGNTSKIAVCTVTCQAAVPETVTVTGISLDNTTLTVNANSTNTIKATITPSNATNKTVNWSSSDTTIATVTASTTSGNNAIVTWKKAGLCTITATATGNPKVTATCTVHCQEALVTGISLDKTSLSIDANGTGTINATVTPSNATNKIISWKSSNTEVATVTASSDTTATVTWKKSGLCTITATATGNPKVTATCTVDCQDALVTGISLDKTSLSIDANGTGTINATITPSNATNKTVKWASSNTSVAIVTESTTSGNNATVTWKKAGSCTITATAAGNTSKIAVCTVTCKSASNNYFYVGTTKPTSLSQATIVDSYPTEQTYTNNSGAKSHIFVLTNSNKNVTFEDPNTHGTVTQNPIDTTTIPGYNIFETSIGLANTKDIIIKISEIVTVTGISLDKTSLSIDANGTGTINATVTPSNATNKIISWKSSNTEVATVTVSSDTTVATVTWKKAGSCTITATAAGNTSKIAVCTVTCKSASNNYFYIGTTKPTSLSQATIVDSYPAEQTYTNNSGAKSHIFVLTNSNKNVTFEDPNTHGTVTQNPIDTTTIPGYNIFETSIGLANTKDIIIKIS